MEGIWDRKSEFKEGKLDQWLLNIPCIDPAFKF